MNATTDMLTVPRGTAGRESTSPADPDPPSTGRRVTLGWVAGALAGIVITLLALVTFNRGDGDEIPAQGWYPEAEAYERQAHLEGQARLYLGATRADPDASTDGDSSDDGFLPGSRHMPTG